MEKPKYREILDENLKLAFSGEPQSACAGLKEGLAWALLDAEGNRSALLMFARNLGIILDNNGDSEAAECFYQIALLADPNDSAVYFVLSDLYLRKGKADLSNAYHAKANGSGSPNQSEK